MNTSRLKSIFKKNKCSDLGGVNIEKKILTSNRNRHLGSHILLFVILLLLSTKETDAQVSTLTCNVPEQMNLGTHSSMTVSSNPAFFVLTGGISNEANAISASTSDFATISTVVGLGSYWIAVKDGAAGVGGYPAGTFAGFEVSSSSIVSLLSGVSLTTYLGGVAQETVSSSSLLVSSSLLSSGSRGTIGFKTTLAFDEIRYTISGVSLLSTTNIYNAVFEKFCAGATLSCNTPTTLTSPSYPVTVDMSNTGTGGVVCAGCSVANPDNVVDAVSTNFATITLTAGVLATGSIAVIDNITTYPIGTFAGFDIESSSLLSVGVLSNLTVSTYKAGVFQESFSGSSLVSAGSSVLAGSGRQIVGSITTKTFDEVKLTAANTVSISLGAINVYGVVLEKFCSAPLPSCNTLTNITNTTYPVYVDGQQTGVNSIACVACSINNSQNVVDGTSTSDFASIVLTTGVATTANFAVANALDTYPAKSFAGFDIETNSVLSASVISSATISLYNNGTLVQTGTGNALIVGASTTLLASTTRQIVGIVANVAYDEVKISFNQLVGADLGSIKIYNAVLENTCAATIFCNSTYYLNSPNFPTVIDANKSGVTGAVSAAVTIADPWNVITASTTDFSRITNTASVASVASIAVVDPLTTYPTGTFAGFVINTGSPILATGLFPSITINTYLNGTLQESKAGTSGLLDLTVLSTLIGTPSGTTFNVGFYTTLPFNEIQISISSLLVVGLLGGYVDVYGAFIDTRFSSTSTASITCLKTFPDINATFIGVPVSGNINTNDIVPTGTTYGTPVAMLTNPTTTLPSINPDGSYTFTPTTAGVYQFSVPVCVAGSVTPCPMELLTITVLDKTVGATNPPVANTDIAVTKNNFPVTIVALSNDAIGTPGSKLDTSSITIIDLNGATAGNTAKGGTATVNTTTGTITYTPPLDFIGVDTVQYRVCDNQPTPMCAVAYQVITVLAPGAPNTTSAADDYKETVQGVPISNNVLINDVDPEGDSHSVTAQSISVPGQYTFVLNTDGSYTFTPDASFTGPVAFVYQVCDNGTPVACSNATANFLVSPASFPLPVTLVSFNAKMDGCNAVLSWKSAIENNLKYYTLEYSSNATTWQTVAIVYGLGNGSNYTQNHIPENGNGYYRLKITNSNNSSNYSNVIKITNTCSNTNIEIYPNPAQNQLQIILRGVSSINNYELFDAFGRIVLKGSLQASGGNKIDISSIRAGVYMLKIIMDENVSTQPIHVLK
jgi:large repetitive protein